MDIGFVWRENPGEVQTNAAARFSQLRLPGASGPPGRSSRPSTRPWLFVVAAIVLYAVVAKLAGFWPFAGERKLSDPPGASQNGAGNGAAGAGGPSGSTGPTGAGRAPLPRPDPNPRRTDPPRPTPEPTPVRPAAPTPAPLAESPGRVESRPQSRPADASSLVVAAEAAIMDARRGDDAETLRRAVSSRAWDDRFPVDVRLRWLDESRRLARRVVFSATPMTNATSVTVKEGDHYVGICQRLKKEQRLSVTPAFLELVNGVKPAALRPKMTLKVPTEPLSLVVDKDEFRLYVLLGDCHVLDYEVGIGRDEKTAEGAYTIQWKTKNPTWTDPKSGKLLAYGQPGHVIGNRWMGFANAEGGRTGFGIHGTAEPASVGKAQSDGCIRLRTPDVEALFDLVPTGAKVVVRR